MEIASIQVEDVFTGDALQSTSRESAASHLDTSVSYLNQVKNRVQPEIYNQFVCILEAFQFEHLQGIQTYDQLYSKVYSLFDGDEELLEGFLKFLPNPFSRNEINDMMSDVTEQLGTLVIQEEKTNSKFLKTRRTSSTDSDDDIPMTLEEISRLKSDIDKLPNGKGLDEILFILIASEDESSVVDPETDELNFDAMKPSTLRDIRELVSYHLIKKRSKKSYGAKQVNLQDEESSFSSMSP